MKRILTIILFCAGFVLNGQTITGDKVIARTQLELATYKVTGISNDSGMTANSIMTLPTQYAVRNYVQNYVNSHAASAAGSSGQIQYNNAGSFGALDSLTVASNPDRLGVGVPVPTARVDIQGSGSTTATTALMVRNSSGGVLFKVRDDGYVTLGSAGTNTGIDVQGTGSYSGIYSPAYSPASNELFVLKKYSNSVTQAKFDFTTSGSPKFGFGENITPLAGIHNAINTTASTPSMLLSGTGYSGGTATTTKPTLLIEPTGTTSTGWSTSGTKLGINAESGFTGNLLDLQVTGASSFKVTSGGAVTGASAIFTNGVRVDGGNNFYFSGKGFFQAPSIGVFRFSDNTDANFNRIQFGGGTSSYPAIKRNGAGLDIRLADDSGYGAVQSLYDRFGSGSPESVVTAPVGAVYHRTDGGAGTSFYVKESGTGNTGWISK